MYFKLAWNNVRKSLKDYTIYFLTLSFGVCLFYVFNAIGDQQALQAISGSTKDMLKLLLYMMNIASVFVAVILGFLIIYANKFLIKRRKKELGLYQCLGMKKSSVSRVLIMETLFIGVFALAVGLIVGVFLSQGMSVLTAKMFDAKLEQLFTFTFSKGALFKSILYFGVIFLVVMIFNTIIVSKYRLIDLFMASKKNETLHVKSLGLSVVLFLISLATLGGAYYFIIDNGMLVIDWEFWSAIVLGIIGTFLFFLSLSGFLLRVVKSSKRIYYKGLNMFVLRQINSKITTTYISMTVICVMLLVAIGTLSTGIGATTALKTSVEESTPYGASITYTKMEFTAADYLKAKGVSVSDLVEEQGEVRYFEVDTVTYKDVYSNETLSKVAGTTPKEKVEQTKMSMIPLSDYNKALKMQGKDPVSLEDGEYLMNCNLSLTTGDIQAFLDAKKELTINGKTYVPKNGKMMDVNLSTAAMPSDSGTIIVPDAAVQGLKQVMGVRNLNFHSTDDTDEKEFRNRMENGNKVKEYGRITVFTQQDMRDQSVGLSTVICYLAIYVGLIFLLTCAAVLALQQLTESADNLERYRLLRKIGTENRQIHGAIGAQIGIYFAVPLLLALVHSLVGISVAKTIVDTFGKVDSLGSILFTTGILVLIYGGYGLATYFGSKAIVAVKK